MISAGIDIGTNTILMVIAETADDGTVTVINDLHRIPRLGMGVDASGAIANDAIERALEVLKEYREILDAAGSPPTLCVGTSALRDATNRDDVVRRLSNAINAPVWVIDGNAEAQLTFVGTVGMHSSNAIVIDIGGGSTEIVKGAMGSVDSSASINIGALRLTERYLSVHPAEPRLIEAMFAEIKAEINSHLIALNAERTITYAVAGTPVALASLSLGLDHYDEAAIQGFVLTKSEIKHRLNQLLAMDLDELHSLPGVSKNRADILPAGAAILYFLMDFLEIDHVLVNTQGLRFGIMYVAATETT